MTTTITDGTTTVTPVVVAGYQAAQPARNVVHTLIGAAGQAVTLIPTGLRTGQLTAVFGSYTAAQQLATMLGQALVFTLADTVFSGVGMRFVLAASGKVALELDTQSYSAWVVTFDYQEVTS